MFPGGGFGVGVTVADVQPVVPASLLPPGAVERPMRLGEAMPVSRRTDEELAAELQRVARIEAQLAAYRAELVMGLAARRPNTFDRRFGEPGAGQACGEQVPPGVSEFFADELALILRCSRAAATVLTETSETLVTRLPATWAALADGELDYSRARAIAGELGWQARDVDPAVVAEVEAAVLPAAADLSVTRLKAATRKNLLARDATAAEERRRTAERNADVTVRPMDDGMAELAAFLPLPLALACREVVDTYARMAKEDGDPRRIGRLRAGVMADLMLRPWDTSRPPVTAQLDVVAPLAGLSAAAGVGTSTAGLPRRAGDPAVTAVDRNLTSRSTSRVFIADDRLAEVNGRPITAAHLRELLEHLDALCPGGLQAPASGSLNIALVDPLTGTLRATVSRRDLQRLVRRGCLDHPGGSCACAVLERPPPVDRYEPTPAQRRFARTRDRTCRHPGCRNKAGWTDLDHVLPHAAGGETDCANLCCLCRRHHRLKTHAPGWHFAMTADGVLTVTTPSGVTRTTQPPGLRLIAAPLHADQPYADQPYADQPYADQPYAHADDETRSPPGPPPADDPAPF